MATSFKEFSRGDIRDQSGASIPITSGGVSFVNGSDLVKTLRAGISGFHRGTKQGTISFNKPIPKEGAADNFDELVDNETPVTVTAIVSDALAYTVTGIIKGVDYKFSENGMVNGDYAVTGVIERVPL